MSRNVKAPGTSTQEHGKAGRRGHGAYQRGDGKGTGDEGENANQEKPWSRHVR